MNPIPQAPWMPPTFSRGWHGRGVFNNLTKQWGRQKTIGRSKKKGWGGIESVYELCLGIWMVRGRISDISDKRNQKFFFGGVGSLFSLLSLFLLIQGQSSLASIIEFIGIGKISGVFTLIAYLIGANISRYAQFGKMSPRIVIYIIMFFMLWLVLETLF